MEESLKALQRARDLAPRDVADDVDFVLSVFLDFFELLEENEWNLIAPGTSAADDPRLMAFDGDEFSAAIDRIGTFCGLDLNADDEAPPPDTSTPEGTTPGEIPEALVPAGVTETLGIGGGAYVLSTTESFEDVVAFYTDLLGDAFFVDNNQKAALWNTTYEGLQVSVSLAEAGGGVEILMSLLQ